MRTFPLLLAAAFALTGACASAPEESIANGEDALGTATSAPMSRATETFSRAVQSARVAAATLEGSATVAADLADLASVRERGVHLDPRRCKNDCQTPAPTCTVDVDHCGAIPPTCKVTCTNQPATVEVTDFANCTAPVAPTCEKVTAPAVEVCDLRCDATGCHRTNCRTPAPPQVDDFTRCSAPQGPTCATKRVPGPRVCRVECPSGVTAPRCPITCSKPEPLCKTFDCRSESPVPTGFNPADIASPRVLASLGTKAEGYARYTARHFVQGELVTAEVDPMSAPHGEDFLTIKRHHDFQNASGETGIYAAALAYRYEAAPTAANLLALRQALLGLHTVMTVLAPPIPGDAYAPNGFLFPPKDDTCGTKQGPASAAPGVCPPTGVFPAPASPVRPPLHADVEPSDTCVKPSRRGAWARSFGVGWYHDEAPAMSVADNWAEGFMYGFQGNLRAFNELAGAPRIPPRRFRVTANQSRDNVDMVMFGVAAAHDVLSATGAEPVLRDSLGRAVSAFVDQLILDGYHGRDVTDDPLPYLDMRAESPEADPTRVFELLAWLKTCERVSPVSAERARCSSEYTRIASTTLPGVVASLPGAAAPLLAVRELGGVFGQPNHHRPFLLFTALDTLLRYETSPTLAQAYRSFLVNVLHPIAAPRRVPLFDAMALVGSGQGDLAPRGLEREGTSLRARLVTLLNQVPEARNVLAVPTTGLPACAVVSRRYAACTDPRFCNQVSFAACSELQNPLTRDALALATTAGVSLSDANAVGHAGVWSLGPRFLPQREVHGKDYAYRLGAEALCDDWTAGGIYEPSGVDYLLAYGYAKHHRLF